MSDLRDLYQEVILDHSRSPRNFGVPAGADLVCDGFNPLCGDHYTVHVAVDGGLVTEVGFEGDGCAISKAAASTMTEAVKGRTLDDVAILFEAYRSMVTGHPCVVEVPLGKLAVFEGVSEFPMRVKCATLAWHALKGALAGDSQVDSE